MIASSGAVFTDNMTSQADNEGLLSVAKQYIENLAALVPGARVKQGKGPTAWSPALNGRSIRIDSLLADEARQDGWLHAIAEFQAAVTKSSRRGWQDTEHEDRPLTSADKEFDTTPRNCA